MQGPVVGVQAPKCDLQRFPRQDQRQQCEDVRQALARPVAQELVVERNGVARVGLVEQPAAFPDRAADGDFTEHHRQHAVPIDRDRGVPFAHRRQRTSALEADLESQIVEAEDQPIRGALRGADGEHPRQAAPDGKILILIDEHVHELTHVILGDPAQGVDGVGRGGIPGQQPNHQRHQRRGHRLLSAEHRQHLFAVARPQPIDVATLRVVAPAARRFTRLDASARPRSTQPKREPRVVQRPHHDRPRRVVDDVREIQLDRAIQQAPLEGLDVAAVQPAGDENGDCRAGHRQRQDGNRRRGGQNGTARSRPRHRPWRRRDGRSRRR